MKRVARMISALLLLALVTACSSAPKTQQGTDTAKSPAAPSASKPLVFGIYSAPKTFNPWISNDSPSWTAMDMMYSGLTRLDENGQPTGDLAEKWETSPDGKVYTFHLRNNAKWHDGKPVTADDVVFTFTTILDSRVKSVWASRWGMIRGAAEFRSGKADKVSGLEAVDASTFRMTLTEPSAPLLAYLSVQTPIMPKHLLGTVAPDQLEKAAFFQAPVGSGPYKFVQYQSGQYVEYDAVNDYYLGKPGFTKLFLRIGTADVLQAQLQKGEVDIASVDPAEADRVKGLSGVTLYNYPTSIVQAININLDKPYLQDVRVRQAIAYALDKNKLVATVLGSYGQPIDTPLAAPKWAVSSKLTTYPYNVEKAKSLLQEAKWDSSRHLVLRYPTGNKPREASATLIQQALKAVGMEVDLKVSDMATMTADAQKGAFDLLLLGNQTLADPDYIASQYTSTTFPPAGVNYMRYKNPRVDEVLKQGMITTKIEDRKPLYEEFQAILSQDLPKIFLYMDPEIYGVSNRVSGIKPVNANGQWRSLYWNIFQWTPKG